METRSSGLTEEQFKQDKKKYFSEFALRHLSAFRPHHSEGQTLGRSSEVWRNVSEHCLVSGVFADILAEELHLPQDQRENVVKAAILHDWNKKHETLSIRAAQKDGSFSLQTLSAIKEEDSTQLRQLGVSDEIIKLTGANVPDTVEGPANPSEKILWYVDAFLSNTDPLPIQQRFDDLERGWDGKREVPERAQSNIAFSNMYKERYGGQSLYEVQRSLGSKISTEFADKIGYNGNPDGLPIYLIQKFKDRVIHKDQK